MRNPQHRITRRDGLLERSYRSQLENEPIAEAHTERKQPLYTSVDADRPSGFLPFSRGGKVMVEPPGIAPGSGPLITSAFISIVGPKPDTCHIGAKG